MRVAEEVYISQNQLSRGQSSKLYNQIQFHVNNRNQQSKEQIIMQPSNNKKHAAPLPEISQNQETGKLEPLKRRSINGSIQPKKLSKVQLQLWRK